MNRSGKEVEYRDVVGFPGYRVGDDGSVWSRRKTGFGKGRFGEWKKLKFDIDKAGRPMVKLYADGKRTGKVVSWLVAEAFLGPRPDGLLVLHDNDNPADNRPENLKYGDHVQNENDKERNGNRMRGDTHPLAKLDADKVRCIKTRLAEGLRRGLLSELARRYGVDSAAIASIRDGKTWAWVV